MMDVAAYLERIRYTGLTTPDLECLFQIHRAHLLAVPFENLDISQKQQIVCDEGAFVRKIVEGRRGGFCYEMNGAFAALLRSLGFRVTLLSARVPRAHGSEGPEFDHLALRVDLDEAWLADVGFGELFLEPLRLRTGVEQEQAGRKFRIVAENESLHVERTLRDGAWKREYSFTLQPRELPEFAAMCHYHQTSAESPFTRKRVCTIATAEGRVTLSDVKLIVTRGDRREEQLIESEQEWRDVLKSQFGVVL
jgi:N-hydroxyarylamine O-acetyltransferase